MNQTKPKIKNVKTFLSGALHDFAWQCLVEQFKIKLVCFLDFFLLSLKTFLKGKLKGLESRRGTNMQTQTADTTRSAPIGEARRNMRH